MIKSSTLNFVREKAQEGTAYAELHATLKDIANRAQSIKDEEAKLKVLQSTRLKYDDEAKQAQEAVNKARLNVEAARSGVDIAIKESSEIIANAEGRAKEIIAEAELQRKQSIAGWDKAIADRQDDLKSLDDQVKAAGVVLGQLQGNYSDLKKKHDALASKHDQLVGALAAMKSSL